MADPFDMQERLAEINAERAAKKMAAHQAAEQKLKEAAMPPRMQLAAQVTCPCCSDCTLLVVPVKKLVQTTGRFSEPTKHTMLPTLYNLSLDKCRYDKRLHDKSTIAQSCKQC